MSPPRAKLAFDPSVILTRSSTLPVVWRNGKAFSLKILKAGRSVVASASHAAELIAPVKVAALPFETGIQAEVQGSSLAEGGSKRGLVLAMMQRQQGRRSTT